ncbi:hypothetical protein ACFO25_15070 [Paenactinomyces guangxiensis]|nr:hypothetical protein [Paenactinomyces guangxiensis]
MKKTYRKPQIKKMGDFLKLTLGPHVSGITDGAYVSDGAYNPKAG